MVTPSRNLRKDISSWPGANVSVEGEATVKTFRRHRGRVVLAAANPAYEPLVFAPDEVTILGRVIEVRRRL